MKRLKTGDEELPVEEEEAADEVEVEVAEEESEELSVEEAVSVDEAVVDETEEVLAVVLVLVLEVVS